VQVGPASCVIEGESGGRQRLADGRERVDVVAEELDDLGGRARLVVGVVGVVGVVVVVRGCALLEPPPRRALVESLEGELVDDECAASCAAPLPDR
jgi:hypothetical protein